MADPRTLNEVIDAIVDGTPVRWEAAEAATRTESERALLDQLKCVAMAAGGPPASHQSAVALDSNVRGFRLYPAVVAVAGVKAALGLVSGVLLLANQAGGGVAVWGPVAHLAVFGIAGVLLIAGGARDTRSRRLGMFFLVTASAFSDRLVSQVAVPDLLAVPVAVLTRTATDAFLAYAFWLFVWVFPTLTRLTREGRAARFFLRTAGCVGAVLFAANAVPALAQAGIIPPGLTAAAAMLDRRLPAVSYYWPLLFATLVPALPYLMWKAHLERPENRRRVTSFVVSCVAGVTPISLAVLFTPFIDVFDDHRTRDTVGIFLYAGLLSIVPMTAYAVVVEQAFDVELVITRAMRLRAVRYAVWLMAVVPPVLALGYLYEHRHRTVAEILSSHRSVVLLPLPVAGLIALTFRDQLLRAIDRRILGEPPPHLEVLAWLERALRDARGVRDVVSALSQEVNRALHPTTVSVLVLDETGRRLISPTDDVAALPLDTTLGTLIRFARDEIHAGVTTSTPVQRLLPEQDRRWLADHGFELIVTLTASNRDVLGIIALGQKRSETPFSTEDRLLLAAMANHGAMTLENRSLRDRPYRYLTHPARRTWTLVDWDDEPAMRCRQCGRIWPARHLTCECGGATESGVLPFLLRGKFRIETLIGSGGMSDVYLATDISLNRRVVIKALPCLTPDRVARHEREAAAMASVAHPNLAVIFGIESWRGAPLLLMEFLEGGTLADRLRYERLSPLEAVELGIVLADVLEQLHAADVLHRDIKPSNIGYTRSGVAKLMDFGVAYLLPAAAAATPSDPEREATRSVSYTSPDHVVGTPLYLSPEAIAGAEADASFDLWSLGLTLFESMAGRNPFHAPTAPAVFDRIRRGVVPDLRELVPDCPEPLVPFFEDALARDSNRRPASAAQMRDRLNLIRSALQRG